MRTMTYATVVAVIQLHERIVRRLDEVIAAGTKVPQAALAQVLPNLDAHLRLATYGGGLFVDYLTHPVASTDLNLAKAKCRELRHRLLPLLNTEQARLRQVAGKRLQRQLDQLTAELHAQRVEAYARASARKAARKAAQPELPF